MKMDFKGKRVTLVGLGQFKNGSGLSAAKFLLKQGARLTVTDLKSKDQLKDSYLALEKFARQLKRGRAIKYVWGRHNEKNFIKTDWILRNPQVPNRSKYLELARRHNVPIDTDTSLFLRLCPGSVVGVTGTRGKSTTTTLIYEMIKAGVRKSGARVFLGGNILNSPLNFLDKVRPQDWVVLELSSWQTESFAPFKISPNISVITNLYPDHLNTYTGMKDYAAAKEQIFKWQGSNDLSVINWDNSYTRAMGKRVPSKRFWFSAKGNFADQNGACFKGDKIFLRSDGKTTLLGDVKNTRLLGEHNRVNILAAAAAANLAGVDKAGILQVIKNFPGLPHRLQFVREIKGVKFYNDTTATTAEGVTAALKSFPSKRVVLIAGGSEKNLPFDKLAQEIIKHVSALVLLDDEASFRMARGITTRYKNFPIFWAFDMSEAVKKAFMLAKKNDIILMSPACASYGLFKNEFDRGEKFMAAARAL